MKLNKKTIFIIGGIISAIILIILLLFTIIIPNYKYNKLKKYIQNNERFELVSKGVYKDTDLSQYDITYDLNKKTYTRINGASDDTLISKTVVNILNKSANFYLFSSDDYKKNSEKNYICNFKFDYSEDEPTYEIKEDDACVELLISFPILQRNFLLEIELTLAHMFDDINESKSGLYDNCKYCED